MCICNNHQSVLIDVIDWMDWMDWMDCHCETMVWLEILCQFGRFLQMAMLVDFKFGGLSTRNHGVMLHYPHDKWMYTACVQMRDSQ